MFRLFEPRLGCLRSIICGFDQIHSGFVALEYRVQAIHAFLGITRRVFSLLFQVLDIPLDRVDLTLEIVEISLGFDQGRNRCIVFGACGCDGLLRLRE